MEWEVELSNVSKAKVCRSPQLLISHTSNTIRRRHRLITRGEALTRDRVEAAGDDAPFLCRLTFNKEHSIWRRRMEKKKKREKLFDYTRECQFRVTSNEPRGRSTTHRKARCKESSLTKFAEWVSTEYFLNGNSVETSRACESMTSML